MAVPAEPLIDVNELARRLGVSPWWVRRAVHERASFPVHRVGPRHLRFDLEAVFAWIDANDPAKPLPGVARPKPGQAHRDPAKPVSRPKRMAG